MIRLAVVLLIILLFVFALAIVGSMVTTMLSKDRNPEAVLASRFAKGEIDEAEYARRLAILRYGPPLELPD